DIDTSHFLGNHAPLARIDACDRPDADSLDSIEPSAWTPVLEQTPLQAGSHNLFTVVDAAPATHLRLTITPDGGVARLRAFGDVVSSRDAASDDEARANIEPGEVDLAALRHGARALACSDMFF